MRPLVWPKPCSDASGGQLSARARSAASSLAASSPLPTCRWQEAGGSPSARCASEAQRRSGAAAQRRSGAEAPRRSPWVIYGLLLAYIPLVADGLTPYTCRDLQAAQDRREGDRTQPDRGSSSPKGHQKNRSSQFKKTPACFSFAFPFLWALLLARRPAPTA
jgi:hypothetical protein